MPQQDGSQVGANWSVAALNDWSYALFNMTLVRDSDDMALMHDPNRHRTTSLVVAHVAGKPRQETPTPHAWDAGSFAVGFFPRLCQGDALLYQQALRTAQERHSGTVSAAISTNTALGNKACANEINSTLGGVCVHLGKSGLRLAMPPSVASTPQAVADWLDGLMAKPHPNPSLISNDSGSKAEL